MKKFIVLLVIFTLLISCSEQVSEIDPAQAYYRVFESLINTDLVLNNEMVYLAFDLTNAKLTDTVPFIQLAQNYCDTNGYKLLIMSFEELEEAGYIEDIYKGFKEGVVISFHDKELTDTKLVTAANKWKSGIGAVGADFTVEKINDSWEITGTDRAWIS